MSIVQPLLTADGICFAFGDRQVLHGISLRVEQGQVVALLGPNGCGKSTLLRVLLGQHRPSGGGEGVRWDGIAVGRWRPREFARRVAYLPQQPAYLAGQSVAEAIAVGRYPHQGLLGLQTQRDSARVRDAAAMMDLSAELDRPVGVLSGGQRQRVFLARCLAQEPAALLLDEPDTFLDLQHVAQLAGLLRRLARSGERSGGGGVAEGGEVKREGMAVILATHNLHLAAAVADRVLLMSQGRLAAEGPPSEVLTPDRVAAVYGVRAVRWSAEGQWGMGIVY